jgi:hypothetical protein
MRQNTDTDMFGLHIDAEDMRGWANEQLDGSAQMRDMSFDSNDLKVIALAVSYVVEAIYRSGLFIGERLEKVAENIIDTVDR